MEQRDDEYIVVSELSDGVVYMKMIGLRPTRYTPASVTLSRGCMKINDHLEHKKKQKTYKEAENRVTILRGRHTIQRDVEILRKSGDEESLAIISNSLR